MGKNNLMQKMMAMCREAFADGQRVGQQQTFDAVMIYLHRNGWRYLSEIKSPDGKRTEGWVFDLDERAGAKRRADAVRLWREKKSSK